MKLLFSEATPNHAHYIYPYSIWAVPDPGEKPSAFFDRGFLPSSRLLDRFYLCRQVRIDLGVYRPSSENRRILRKGEGIQMRLIPRADFQYTEERRQFFKRYADARFGQDVMSFERLDSLFSTPITSHLLAFTDAASGAEVGTVVLYLEGKDVAFYYYAFYDLEHAHRNLGMFMMTSAVELFAREKFRHVYLGSCYSRNALYKTQFDGAEFFTGFRWSNNLEELKYLLNRSERETSQHLLETDEYRQLFYEGQLAPITEASWFRVESQK